MLQLVEYLTLVDRQLPLLGQPKMANLSLMIAPSVKQCRRFFFLALCKPLDKEMLSKYIDIYPIIQALSV